MSPKSGRKLVSRSALLTIALVGAGSAPASAIKIVGTDGRDEISVTPSRRGYGQDQPRIRVRAASGRVA